MEDSTVSQKRLHSGKEDIHKQTQVTEVLPEQSVSDSRGTGTRAELRGGLPGSGQTGRECTVQVSKQPCGVDTWVWGEGYTLQSSVALASSRESCRNGRVQGPACVLP